MKTLKRFFGLVLLMSLIAACEVFQDLTPKFITVRMSGPVGQTVSIVYSKEFIAGVDEMDVTRVAIYRADTVLHTLPFDTIIDVRIERRLFLQAEVSAVDAVNVDVAIAADGRTLYDRAGDLFPDIPWRFLYQFNHSFTDVIEVEL
ncbi:MAG: hypothetical protein OSA81_03100 [Longimicrobiales bacterium]|nr:hypothetical protein [Longimicrobiales bacterium]